MTLNIGKLIKELRRKKGLTQAELARRLNYSRQLVSLWEIDESMPDAATVKQLAELFNVSADYLLGRTTEPQPPETLYAVGTEELTAVPVIGWLDTGTPLSVRESEREYVCLPQRLLPPGELLILQVHEESMCGGDHPICSGCLAILRKDAEITDREIYAVQVDDEEAILRRVHFHGEYVDLLPDNPAFAPSIHRADAVTILGKLIYIMQQRG
ncbi:MAG: LexA family protein [Armatimonadota bacterium]